MVQSYLILQIPSFLRPTHKNNREAGFHGPSRQLDESWLFLYFLQPMSCFIRLYSKRGEGRRMDTSYLVRQARKGNDESFEQLIDSVRNKLYRTAYSYVRNEQDALDLYQEAIYEAYLSLKKLKKPEQFQSWITKIIVFKSIDFIRKSSKHFLAADELFEQLMSGEGFDNLEQSLDLTKAFESLDVTYKTMILLRYYHDLSIKEIAEFMDYPEGTVKSNLHRAKQILRPILKEGYLHG